MEQHRSFSAEEARKIGERIGISWDSSRFDRTWQPAAVNEGIQVTDKCDRVNIQKFVRPLQVPTAPQTPPSRTAPQ
jgi:hypothetical protein